METSAIAPEIDLSEDSSVTCLITHDSITLDCNSRDWDRNPRVARITGTDPKYTYARKFVDGALRSLRGTADWDLPAYTGQPELWEYNGLVIEQAYGKTPRRAVRGFFLRTEKGVARVGAKQAAEIAAEMDGQQ